MAKPQIEEGYTRIANEIMEIIPLFCFNGSQRSIIDVVWRFTYGFQRKDHEFSVSFLSEGTGISERAIKRELATMIEAKVLEVTKEATNKTSRRLAFNKNYDSWGIEKRGERMKQMEFFEVTNPTPLEVTNPTPQNQSRGDKLDTQERNKDLKENYKEIINKRFDEFWSFYPKKVGKVAALKHFTRIHNAKGFKWEDFIKGTKAYVEYCQRENRFLKDGSAFVNQETYKDFLEDMPTTNIRKTSVNYDKSTKLDKNKELLFGGNQKNGRTRREVNTSQSFGSLPEPT